MLSVFFLILNAQKWNVKKPTQHGFPPDGEKLCVKRGAPTLAGTCENFHTYIKCEVKIQWDMGMGHSWLNGSSICDSNGVGQLWQIELLFLEVCSKNTGLQGSTISSHHMTMGFGPFELPTHGLLQKGWDHSPPKACFQELLVGIQSAINNRLEVGLNGWSYMTLTRGVGKPTYGLLCRLILVGHLGGLLFDGRCSCTKYYFAGHSGLQLLKRLSHGEYSV